MIEIKKCGSYLEVDSEGLVKSIDKTKGVQEKWRPVVDETLNFYQKELGDSLHSVYIRGSVATGDAVDAISDLDSFAVVKSDAGKEPASLKLFHKEMTERYPFCTHVEISVIEIENIKKVPAKRIRSIWEKIIKTQSICVFGTDLAETIAPIRINEMIDHSLFLEDEVKNKLPGYIEEDKNDPEGMKSTCLWIMRRLLRGAFDLVLVKEGRFSRDLYCCYESTAKFYPEQEETLKKVLNLALNPSEKYNEWLPLVEELCSWIVKESEKQENNSA